MEKLSATVKRPLWVAGLNIALALTIGSSQAFANGGTYYIADQTDLAEIGSDAAPLDGDYVVTTSFGVVAPVSGGSTYVAGNFTGTFDGGGFTISGLTKPLFEVIDGDDSGSVAKHISDLTLEAAAGGVTGSGILAIEVSSGTVIDKVDVRGKLFGGLSVGGLVGFNEGTISNSSATGDVNGDSNVGGLVGISYGTITDSYATGAVTGVYGVGGLVGFNGGFMEYSGGTITDSYATGVVIGDESVGGLVGVNGGFMGVSGGTITDSYATGVVTGDDEVGGLVGDNGNGTITDSYATGAVTGGDNNAGGLVGINDGEISDSYAIGTVTGNYSVGGLVGRNDNGTINENSYAAGFVTGFRYVGGLVGENGGDISNSYATGAVTGNDVVGGLVGWNFEGDISNSYATGAVTGDYNLGGLVGFTEEGNISNSYATGAVTGDDDNIGGLVGFTEEGNISNSYATGAVTGNDDIGGLVGENGGDISNSYATGAVTGNDVVGGLAGYNGRAITDSYATGAVNGVVLVGGLVGENGGDISNSYATGAVTGNDVVLVGRLVGSPSGTITESYATGAVNGEESGVPPLSPNELLEILNTGSEDPPIFALASNLNNGRPYLISNPPLADEAVAVSARVKSSYLLTQALDVLKKSVGFTVAKSDLSKLDLALLDQVKGDKSSPITGAKLLTYQSLTTSLSVGGILQLEINFEANKSLQMWVKSSDDQYVLVGDITFDKDGNAVLPGIEFKKSGQYELIFVNSDKKGLTQPELMNKVIGLTVYVN
jgi:hypothetical protein